MSEEKLQQSKITRNKKSSRFSPKKIIIGSIIITITALGIYGYYKYNKIFPRTDNAYVNADIISISPKVGGYIE
ncbi:HlyD family secretion protein, partial [Francisella tularensis subsp. holarctica]|nr:HlyD family secretion protein [Francisella tularensis subsp. holarctica]